MTSGAGDLASPNRSPRRWNPGRGGSLPDCGSTFPRRTAVPVEQFAGQHEYLLAARAVRLGKLRARRQPFKRDAFSVPAKMKRQPERPRRPPVSSSPWRCRSRPVSVSSGVICRSLTRMVQPGPFAGNDGCAADCAHRCLRHSRHARRRTRPSRTRNSSPSACSCAGKVLAARSAPATSRARPRRRCGRACGARRPPAARASMASSIGCDHDARVKSALMSSCRHRACPSESFGKRAQVHLLRPGRRRAARQIEIGLRDRARDPSAPLMAAIRSADRSAARRSSRRSRHGRHARLSGRIRAPATAQARAARIWPRRMPRNWRLRAGRRSRRRR